MPRIRFVALFLVLTVALFGVLTRTADRSSAQDATPPAASTLAGFPLVGAWLADTDVNDPNNPPSLFIFTSDGIYMQSNADGSDGYGTWRVTGPNTAELTILFNSTDESGKNANTDTVRARIEVAPDGQSFTAQYTLESSRGPAGEYGPGMVSGTRINVESMGTPVGTLNDLFGPQASPVATPS